MYITIKIRLFVSVMLIGTSLFGQTTSDTLVVKSETELGSTSPPRNAFKDVFRGKPGRAALYSLIIPGGGQIYNKRWWKLPITYAIEGGAFYWLYFNRSEYKKFDGIFDDLVNGIDDPSDIYNVASDVKPIRDFYRKRTEYAWVFMILAHIYNVFDAYIDRHLMDFDVSDDLSLQVFPASASQPVTSFGLAYKF